MTKYIVVVGGVISGVGKGVSTASIGKIMQEYGYSVTAIKIDPYINVDAGTMRPTEHGEVYVTEDGGETDQDIGTYERFLGISVPRKNSITTGQVYNAVIEKERKGDYLGKTVQFIPHIPEEIKLRIKEASKGYDICLIEVGGTVGDYENIPFLIATKSLEKELGRENLIHILVTYLPTPSHIVEMKTKPTQMAIKLLEESGIHPDFILCRGQIKLDEVRKKKIETYAHIPYENIISMPDVTGKDKPNTLYIIPLELERENMGEKIIKKLALSTNTKPNWAPWEQKINSILNPEKTIKIAMIGKYINIGDYQLQDSYISVSEAVKHASANNNVKTEIAWINADDLNSLNISQLSKFNGIIVPGGFGTVGIEGKISAIKYCRENNIPFLGLCYGLQLAVIEYARNVCNLKDANTTEVNPLTRNPVIDILPEQKEIDKKGGTMRLGAYKAILKDNTKVKSIYNQPEVYERHRHRYEVNPLHHQILEENNLVISGKSPDNKLAEFIELPNHKFFVATQAHPEFKSSLLKPAPLFNEFIKAAAN